jgi:hypothetical protein
VGDAIPGRHLSDQQTGVDTMIDPKHVNIIDSKHYTDTHVWSDNCRVYASFEGTSIAVDKVSWCITREMAPIYTMGKKNPRSFSRANRGLAGSITMQGKQARKLIGATNQESLSEIYVVEIDGIKQRCLRLKGVQFLSGGRFTTLEDIGDATEVLTTFIGTERVDWKDINDVPEESR